MKKRLLFTALLCWVVGNTYAQINVKYLGDKKTAYKAGDKIELLISLKTLPITCKDGIDRVKIYVSGLTIAHQSEWKKCSNTVWQKTIVLEVINNSKSLAKLTIIRKVDKEDLFCQELFKIST